MKANEFWKCLCDKFNYRLFAGVQCSGFNKLYDTMKSDFLHYVPTAKENIAIGVISGARLAGVNGAVLMSSHKVCNIADWLSSFNLNYRVPILILMYNNDNNIDKLLSLYNISYRYLGTDFYKDIRYIINKMNKLSTPGVCIINKGVLD